MALGKRQKEQLAKIVEMVQRNEGGEGHVRIEVKIERKRAYTRELGRGIAIVITPYECYPEGEYKMQSSWIADCQYDYTAVSKGQEIARYLVDQGVLRERVRLIKV